MVSIPKMNIIDLYTPVELPKNVILDHEIVISKKGYQTYKGRIRNIGKQADSSYLVRLRPGTETFPQ